MVLLCGWKNDTWLMAFSLRFFRAYSINEYNISQFMTFKMVVVCGWKSATYLLNVALFHPHMFSSIMREHRLLRSHLPAQYVTRHLHHQMVCKIMKELIVERDHSAAQNVTSHSQCQIFWSKMREQVLVRNHSTAQHATRHFHHQMVHVFMAFRIILQCVEERIILG